MKYESATCPLGQVKYTHPLNHGPRSLIWVTVSADAAVAVTPKVAAARTHEVAIRLTDFIRAIFLHLQFSRGFQLPNSSFNPRDFDFSTFLTLIQFIEADGVES
ncbi:hypothetical protein ACH4ZX_40295 [Streptomyces sp. NPDC020490]|uniref:hypothetical protein n=1 Tax=Streptomyces sp. NPDC020490 TaxID=3365078 RepID=UPI0037B6B7AF